MIKLIKNIFTRDNLKQDSALAERRARLEKVTGVKSKHWQEGKEFAQNKVTMLD